MRNTFSVLALVLCGLWGASRATATPSYCTSVTGNLVTNCGFELGDFTGWTISGLTDNPGGNYYGVDSLPIDVNTGSSGAYMSQDFVDDGAGFVNLSQTLATMAGVSYIVSFFLEQDTAPNTGYTHAFSAAFGGTTLLTLTPTVVSPGPVGVFTQYSFVESATGPSTVLNFAFENDDNYWSFDDVSVAAPEPSTFLLAGAALGGLALLRRRIAG
jgi:hypothetical protein